MGDSTSSVAIRAPIPITHRYISTCIVHLCIVYMYVRIQGWISIEALGRGERVRLRFQHSFSSGKSNEMNTNSGIIEGD